MRFEDLEVWKRSARLSADVYRGMQSVKDFGFRDQWARAGLSVPSNPSFAFRLSPFASHLGTAMPITIEQLVAEVKTLPEKELDQFLSWLADYEPTHSQRWDQEIERDSQPGERLDVVLQRVRGDIAAGRIKPLDEVI